jgi:hypothetical protein
VSTSIGTCRLDDLADIKLGVKTFLNQFFYVDRERVAAHGIEARFLEPVFRPRDAKRDRFLQRSADCEMRIFECDTTVDKLMGTGAAAYIKWASKQRYKAKRDEPGGYWKDTPAVKPKKRVWYQNQAMPPPARIVVLKLIDDSFAPLILDKPVRVDQSFNQVNAKPGVDEDLLVGLLCSMWFVMLLETFGRVAMGQGALQVPTETLRGLPVPDIRNLTGLAKMRWLADTKKLLAGPRMTATRSSKSKEQRALDACVLTSLGLDSGRLEELYADTLRMGEVRRLLAAGRGTMRRERFAVDLDQVAKDVAAQLKPLLAGRRFPRDFVPAGEPTEAVHLGNAPLRVRSELMLGQRHVLIAAGDHIIYEHDVAEATGDLIVRAVQCGQRVIDVPVNETASQAALSSLHSLVAQLDFRLNELGATAGVQVQAPLRERAEAHLNLPVGLLFNELGAVYDGEH